ncbi:DUF167 domain-containing protein [Salidesulfovibrio onnuriiensis]|uniref:DUF167 domain-containing protein n=1 Tax=Salidesulfovibrio onnuriiensis TaxID=2583823 RepID=UPI0011CC8446|nr:DUF167 domain-containing protein [Salidesulfovibrio onnuriiensis]
MIRETIKTLPEFARQKGDSHWNLDVWVQPGARKNGLAGTYQGCLKVRLNAPAVDNKANKALVAYLADQLGLKKNQVTLESGQSNRRKVLAVDSRREPDWERLVPSGEQ